MESIHIIKLLEDTQEENEKLRESLNLVIKDYSKRKLTYGWHDLLINKIKRTLGEKLLSKVLKKH